ncbi:hypothetical protein BT63DRAFT_429921 [Microthyrium microscopicum]|uniref:Uncharacterized protein n=1 Tax=Microthyrium microscopicum TaxID=703497 RepID=A0A6A6TXS1_9PEZI|nr:hypothetical protein BT63DRAFT_429921 [Microthyrium microscopicum]
MIIDVSNEVSALASRISAANQRNVCYDGTEAGNSASQELARLEASKSAASSGASKFQAPKLRTKTNRAPSYVQPFHKTLNVRQESSPNPPSQIPVATTVGAQQPVAFTATEITTIHTIKMREAVGKTKTAPTTETVKFPTASAMADARQTSSVNNPRPFKHFRHNHPTGSSTLAKSTSHILDSGSLFRQAHKPESSYSKPEVSPALQSAGITVGILLAIGFLLVCAIYWVVTSNKSQSKSQHNAEYRRLPPVNHVHSDGSFSTPNSTSSSARSTPERGLASGYSKSSSPGTRLVIDTNAANSLVRRNVPTSSAQDSFFGATPAAMTSALNTPAANTSTFHTPAADASVRHSSGFQRTEEWDLEGQCKPVSPVSPTPRRNFKDELRDGTEALRNGSDMLGRTVSSVVIGAVNVVGDGILRYTEDQGGDDDLLLPITKGDRDAAADADI